MLISFQQNLIINEWLDLNKRMYKYIKRESKCLGNNKQKNINLHLSENWHLTSFRLLIRLDINSVWNTATKNGKHSKK